MSPLGQGFLRRFREPEVNGARKKLLGSVDAAGSQKLLRANHAQQIALLRPNQVLAALSAGSRQISGASLSAAREIGQQRRVLIVRVGGYHEHASQDV